MRDTRTREEFTYDSDMIARFPGLKLQDILDCRKHGILGKFIETLEILKTHRECDLQ